MKRFEMLGRKSEKYEWFLIKPMICDTIEVAQARAKEIWQSSNKNDVHFKGSATEYKVIEVEREDTWW